MFFNKLSGCWFEPCCSHLFIIIVIISITIIIIAIFIILFLILTINMITLVVLWSSLVTVQLSPLLLLILWFYASLHVWRYLNPSSQTSLRQMWSNWTCVLRSTMGKFEQHKSRRVLSWYQFSRTPKSLFYYEHILKNVLLPYLLTGIVNLLIGYVPESQSVKVS